MCFVCLLVLFLGGERQDIGVHLLHLIGFGVTYANLQRNMALLEFFGCAFLAFGPPLAMFLLTIAKDPIRIIILIAR